MIKTWSLSVGVGAMLAVMVFVCLPALDLSVAQWFYQKQFVTEPGIFLWIYTTVPTITQLTVGYLLVVILYSWRSPKRIGLSRNAAIFFLLCWLLGPGLLVNFALKDHVGRPRPVQITAFQGHETYAPPFTLSNGCQRNCSFVSGHASVGFVFVALAFVYRHYRYALFAAGMLAGSIIGYVRMAQGGHFLSDVIFSFVFTYVGIVLAYAIMTCLRLSMIDQPEADAHTDNRLDVNDQQAISE